MENEEKQNWLDAMQDDMKYLHDNHVYDLVKFPKGKKAFGKKRMYRMNDVSNSKSPRYKVRLVVKFICHRNGVDFKDIFSHVVKKIID